MSQNMMSVSSLNTKIKSLLEATFMHTLVEGEVASVTYHTSGHLYFSIKDDKSSIKCVMWRSSVARMKFRIEKGMHIVVEGSVSVYTPRGEYQFQTVRIEPAGQGALALAFEQLKKKLKEKGYFLAEHKKPLPEIPKRIALVTAKESAALHDMLKIIEKRWRFLEVTIVDTLVQGESAAAQIARSLAYADSLGVDVVVVGRGGGSAEDLWAFNEEVVADALFAMQTPVVSAVGHEVDTLISDFVADLRAPTPSAAMEMILPDMNEILYTLDDIEERYKQLMNGLLYDKLQKLTHQEEMIQRLSPTQRLRQLEESFDAMKKQFGQVLDYKLEQFVQQPIKLAEQLRQNMHFALQKKEQRLQSLYQNILLNDPKKQTKEGWAQVTHNGKKIVLKDLKVEDMLRLTDVDTTIEAKVVSV
ncbi:MAG: exodeoxyribonuclease VII large subunit [Sulfurovum sp.]|nr:exodeoxyribonuclease VII large subunit [Sulfurovum sp.]